MPRLPRKDQKIFGGSLTASGNVAQVGSTVTGTPVYSTDLDTIQALSAYLNGFSSQIVNGTASPVLQEFNALLRMLTQQVAYGFQLGVPEWNSATEYHTGSVAQDGAGVLYVSLTNNNVGNILTDTNDWEPYANRVLRNPRTAKAWVTFNGTTAALYDDFNAGTVTKIGTGNYLITFDTPLDYSNYAFALSCAQDDTILETVQCTRFSGDTRTQTQLQVRTLNTKTSVGTDVPEVSVLVFAN
jgi:hypothetical protein